MAQEHQALQIISRFGLTLGVGEKTIEEVCNENGLHTDTFLAVINYKVSKESDEQKLACEDIDLQTLLCYLRNAHTYFLDYSLPFIRAQLIEAMSFRMSTAGTSDQSIPMLIIQFFDNYVSEINIHMQHENDQLFPYIEALLQGGSVGKLTSKDFEDQHKLVDDQNIAEKLNELKSLLIKYYPATDATEEKSVKLMAILHEIFETEEDLATHCIIEDQLLIPALKKLEQQKRSLTSETENVSEELTERERDVVIQLVRGLSNKEIADRLCISTHTVISHRKNIVRKLNIHSTAGLTIYAIVNKLVDINSLDLSQA